MSVQLGALHNPLRVAIVGAGPSGFYTAQALQNQAKSNHLTITIDLFERLIAPHGLVRYGVAPDHQNIKAVSKLYERIAADANFRYFGNVEYCKHIHLTDLQQHYHAIVFAVGAQSDRKLGIPGEELPNSFSATEFVAWYNGHPGFAHLKPDLTVSNAVVVGIGNVAMDVARILAHTVNELQMTDIADHALQSLAQSNVREIYILSRRGPAQVKFTPTEAKEFAELAIAEPIVLSTEMKIDEDSARLVENDPEMLRNLETLRNYAQKQPEGKQRRVHFRFLLSPTQIIADEAGKICAIRCEKNRLVLNADGTDMKAVGTGETEIIPVGLVLRSVGYKGLPLDGVPYDTRTGILPNQQGRIVDEEGNVQRGIYVAGWAKRGPTGVIGTNRTDAVETVEKLLEDLPLFTSIAEPDPNSILTLLHQRGVRFVSKAEWQIINEVEIARGKPQGRPRSKIVSPEEMLKLLDE